MNGFSFLPNRPAVNGYVGGFQSPPNILNPAMKSDSTAPEEWDPIQIIPSKSISLTFRTSGYSTIVTLFGYNSDLNPAIHPAVLLRIIPQYRKRIP